jgi:hypothetical protein
MCGAIIEYRSHMPCGITLAKLSMQQYFLSYGLFCKGTLKGDYCFVEMGGRKVKLGRIRKNEERKRQAAARVNKKTLPPSVSAPRLLPTDQVFYT